MHLQTPIEHSVRLVGAASALPTTVTGSCLDAFNFSGDPEISRAQHGESQIEFTEQAEKFTGVTITHGL